jgi:hypothetical protein
MTMPFGKYEGLPLEAIPASYLRWAVRNLDGIDLHLRQAMREVLRRHDEEEDSEPTAGQLVNLPDIIQQWWREQVLQHHPDRGGNLQAFQALSNAHDRLRELAGV